MALVSTKGMYGLAAMYELYTLKSDKPVQIKVISQSAQIPQNYLEQLLGLLKKAGFVSSIRGAHGGYILCENAKDITVKEIFEVLEGDLNIVDSAIKNPALSLFYKEKTDELETMFNISLENLSKYQELVSKEIIYSI